MARLLTVGHGTLQQPDLARLLRGAGVSQLVDIRRYPDSRRHPQVAREALQGWLPGAGVPTAGPRISAAAAGCQPRRRTTPCATRASA
ncbi:MAG: DUF488 domain-containing protein, partial [Actinomycetota bacterium]|nr:DUF488 domain-containing protein [Actinomycetota bacterium]